MKRRIGNGKMRFWACGMGSWQFWQNWIILLSMRLDMFMTADLLASSKGASYVRYIYRYQGIMAYQTVYLCTTPFTRHPHQAKIVSTQTFIGALSPGCQECHPVLPISHSDHWAEPRATPATATPPQPPKSPPSSPLKTPSNPPKPHHS